MTIGRKKEGVSNLKQYGLKAQIATFDTPTLQSFLYVSLQYSANQ